MCVCLYWDEASRVLDVDIPPGLVFVGGGVPFFGCFSWLWILSMEAVGFPGRECFFDSMGKKEWKCNSRKFREGLWERAKELHKELEFPSCRSRLEKRMLQD